MNAPPVHRAQQHKHAVVLGLRDARRVGTLRGAADRDIMRLGWLRLVKPREEPASTLIGHRAFDELPIRICHCP
jgi:hypothetical protein